MEGQSERGSALIQAMVAASALGIIGAGYMNLQHNAIKSSSKMELRDDVVALRRSLRTQVDCKETLDGLPCTPGRFFPLKDKNGNVIGQSGSASEWKIGRWNFRASCRARRMNVEFARLSSAPRETGSQPSFAKDPLNGQKLSWKALFLTGDLDCAEFLGADDPGGLVPVGGIVMWSGARVPDGWALCDGTNGTPDLRGRFIVGTGPGYARGSTGGRSSVTLTANEMPAHNHRASAWTSSSFDGLNSYADVDRGSEQARMAGCGGAGCGWGWRSVAIRPITINVGVSTAVAGAGRAFDTRPPFFSLAYIMKLPKASAP